MARIRTIKPTFFTSEDTCGLTPLARLLFLGLLTEADRAGRLEDRPRQLKRRILPDDDCDVDALLGELAGRDLICRYVTSSVAVVQIINFERHQHPHPKEPKSLLPCFSTAGHVFPVPIPVGTRLVQAGTCTGTGTSTTPLPPLPGGIRIRREHKEDAKKILKARQGYCKHDPPCPNEVACLDVIAHELAQKGIAH